MEHKIGNRYKLVKVVNGWVEGTYILARTDYDHIALICLDDGNRWHDPVESKHNRFEHCIPDEVFEKAGQNNFGYVWEKI